MKLFLTIGFILITFASQSIWVTFSPVLTNVAEELGVQTALVGYLAVLYPLFFLILTIPSGILLDRNFRFWLSFGSVMTFLGGTLRLLMPYSYAWLFICQLLSAIGQPFLLNAFVPFASRLYEKRRALMISIMSLSMYLGTIFALATGYHLYTAGGIEMLITPSAVVSFGGIVLFLAGILLIKASLSASGFAFRIKEVVGKRDLWLLGCILGLGVAVFDNLATWLQPALETVNLGRYAGETVALTIIVGLIGVTFIPSVVSKLEARAIYLRCIIPLITVFFLVLSSYHDVYVLYSFLAISGFLMIPAYPLIMDWIGRFHAKEIHGSATGFVGFISRIISVALMLLAPNFIGSAKLYFVFLAIATALAFFFALMLPNDRKFRAYHDKA